MRITILCHNAYWFQGHPFSVDCPGAPEREILRRLCALYSEARADVLCLQEIQSPEAAGAVGGAMDMEALYTPGHAYPQYGGVIAAARHFPLQRMETREGAVFERSFLPAHIMTPKGVLGVANIHLPSGRQAGPIGAKGLRRQEIMSFLTHYGADTDILAGDFNEGPDGEASAVLKAHGFVDTAVAMGRDATSTAVWYPHRIDFIWIKRHLQSRLKDYGVIQDPLGVDDLGDKTSLSDHLPVWITLDL